jgi:hypothetical protein
MRNFLIHTSHQGGGVHSFYDVGGRGRCRDGCNRNVARSPGLLGIRLRLPAWTKIDHLLHAHNLTLAGGGSTALM